MLRLSMLVLSMLVLSSVLFAQDVIVYETDKFYFKDKVLYYKDSNKPVTGVVRDAKDIKKVRKYYESTYVDGKKNGIQKYFYKGKLSSETPFKNNYKSGLSFSYREGKINSTTLFEGKNETWITYFDYETKHVRSIHSKKDGVQSFIKYMKSGQLIWDCAYKGRRLTKKCVTYYPTGKLMAEIVPNGKKFSGFIYDKEGNKLKATKDDYSAMRGRYLDLGYINKRFSL